MVATVNTDSDVLTLALDALSSRAIVSADDLKRDDVKLLKRTYRLTVDKALASHPWNCAIKRRSIPGLADAPEDTDWRYGYQLPGDCLKLMPVTHDGSFEGNLVPYVVEGDKVLTNAGAPLRIRYIARVPEVYWSPHLVDVIVLSLALKAAYGLQQKTANAEQIYELLKEAIREAKRVDGSEGTIERPQIDDYELGRLGFDTRSNGSTWY